MCVYVCAQLCLTLCNPWTIACQAPLFMEFSRQEYQSGLPFPPPGDLPNPGMEPVSPALAGGFFTAESSGKPNTNHAATQTKIPGGAVNSPLHPHTVNQGYWLLFIPHLPYLIFSSLLFLMILIYPPVSLLSKFSRF